MTEGPRRLRLWVAAAERSGDLLAAELVEALRSRGLAVEARGLAGPAMREAGVVPVGRAEDATAVGVAEVVRQLGALRRLLGRLDRAARRMAPDVAVTVDSPGLMLRHGRALRAAGIPVAHWVAPQVWAWRAGRAARVGASADSLLCLLPFEPPLFHRHGVRALFTGHPAVARVGRPALGPPAVVLAPGSRPAEIAQLAPTLAAVADRLRAAWPTVRFRVPVAPTVDPASLAELPGERCASVADAAQGAVAAVVASGTATIELAALGVPMVVVYRVHPATWRIGRALVRGVRHLALPNVLAGAPIVPEHVQRLDPDAIAAEVLALRDDPGPQRAELARVVARLAGEGATGRAADEVIRLGLGPRPALSARRPRSEPPARSRPR